MLQSETIGLFVPSFFFVELISEFSKPRIWFAEREQIKYEHHLLR